MTLSSGRGRHRIVQVVARQRIVIQASQVAFEVDFGLTTFGP